MAALATFQLCSLPMHGAGALKGELQPPESFTRCGECMAPPLFLCPHVAVRCLISRSHRGLASHIEVVVDGPLSFDGRHAFKHVYRVFFVRCQDFVAARCLATFRSTSVCLAGWGASSRQPQYWAQGIWGPRDASWFGPQGMVSRRWAAKLQLLAVYRYV